MTTDAPLCTQERKEYRFADLLRDETGFPLLKLAAENQERAISTVIEWTMPDGSVVSNYTQIVRVPYRRGASERGIKLVEMLALCEAIIDHGVPSPWSRDQRGFRPGMCGGVRHFLGRPYESGDHLSLRVLRGPMWCGSMQENPYPDSDLAIEDEWLCEFSLQVTPKE